MKKLLLFSFLLLAYEKSANAQPRAEPKPWSHKLEISSLYWHLADPDWNFWQRRNLVPEYQLGYKRFFIKARFFTLGEYYEGDDFGIIYLPGESYAGGERPKEGAVIVRGYKTLDLVPQISVLRFNTHSILVGIGASHRQGIELIQRYNPLSTAPDVDESELKSINAWGVIAEASYSVGFLKYLTASLNMGYRAYPATTGMFTAGVGLGVQIHHQTPW